MRPPPWWTAFGDLAGHGALVEVVGVVGDAAEGGGELGLAEGVA